jgi:hypothetical protein
MNLEEKGKTWKRRKHGRERNFKIFQFLKKQKSYKAKPWRLVMENIYFLNLIGERKFKRKKNSRQTILHSFKRDSKIWKLNYIWNIKEERTSKKIFWRGKDQLAIKTFRNREGKSKYQQWKSMWKTWRKSFRWK